MPDRLLKVLRCPASRLFFFAAESGAVLFFNEKVPVIRCFMVLSRL